MEDVKASKPGSLDEKQEALRPGYRIDKVMQDSDIAVIGPLEELQPEGNGVTHREVGVTCPKGAIFERFLVKKGQHVNVGDPIAEVKLSGRRLADGRVLSETVKVPSPAWGTVQ